MQTRELQRHTASLSLFFKFEMISATFITI